MIVLLVGQSFTIPKTCKKARSSAWGAVFLVDRL
jgi:hypothetical protein